MTADIFLVILAFLCLLVGLAGAVLPLPGPPLSFFGLLLLHWSAFAEFSDSLLISLGLMTLAVTVLDYLVPIWGIRKFGGSRWGVWGSMVGMLLGLFAGPWGLFAGAFAGGLLGELLAGRDSQSALRAALGSFVGFLFGVLLKTALCLVMLWYAVMAMVETARGVV
jgi:uncharacterized protein YqgC (DUF456 family)